MDAEISIVIPTIEEEAIFKQIHKLRSMFKDPEIIIVDKSSDAYYKRLKETGCTIIRQKDRGVESAIMQGLRIAHRQILASIDADGTHELEGIKKGR